MNTTILIYTAYTSYYIYIFTSLFDRPVDPEPEVRAGDCASAVLYTPMQCFVARVWYTGPGLDDVGGVGRVILNYHLPGPYPNRVP